CLFLCKRGRWLQRLL
nr:immunoglobulin heavy chain junction region [Mus musculus]